jgi:tetratricopeptide (TPR) repeat protein
MRLVAIVTLAFVSAVGTVRAAPARSAVSEPSDAGKKGEAQRCFQRGIELYKAGDFGPAQVEFTRAYELVPSYKLLYNLGQVSYQRRDHAAALRYFRQYLADGVDAITAERRQEVNADIADLEQRIGRLQIDAADDGAEVFVDDVLVGKTPLRALITVNGGPRKIDLVGRNGEHQSRQVDVGSGEVARVPFPRLTLVRPPEPAPAARPAPVVAAAPKPAPAPKPEPAADAKIEPLPPAPEPAPEAKPEPAPARAIAAAPSTEAAATVVATPQRRSHTPWKAWALTGLLAGGAAVTGALALSAKHDFDTQVSMFPVDDSEVDYDRRRTRGFALATDGLLIGTAVMAAVSLYLTLRDSK